MMRLFPLLAAALLAACSSTGRPATATSLRLHPVAEAGAVRFELEARAGAEPLMKSSSTVGAGKQAALVMDRNGSKLHLSVLVHEIRAGDVDVTVSFEQTRDGAAVRTLAPTRRTLPMGRATTIALP
jgi:hypothetical protein